MTAKRYFVTCEVGNVICELISRKLSDDEFEHLTYYDIVNRLNELSEENEQLKERNNNQYTQLNRLWGLMEDKDWETMEQMVEEINTAEERLQREWGIYGDVE